MKNKKIIYSLLSVSLLFALILSSLIDKNLYIEPDEYIETNARETQVIKDIDEKIEIKYNWQIAIPKIDVIAPIGEGSDVIILRNRVGHIVGTGVLSRQYMFGSVIIIQETIHQENFILTELTN